MNRRIGDSPPGDRPTAGALLKGTFERETPNLSFLGEREALRTRVTGASGGASANEVYPKMDLVLE